MPPPRSEESIVTAIHNAFCKLDDDILDEVKKSVNAIDFSLLEGRVGSFLDKLPHAYCRAGCCAIVAVIADDNLFVAHVG
jgi:hypothetical protein